MNKTILKTLNKVDKRQLKKAKYGIEMRMCRRYQLRYNHRGIQLMIVRMIDWWGKWIFAINDYHRIEKEHWYYNQINNHTYLKPVWKL